jgi:hypothetical protein
MLMTSIVFYKLSLFIILMTYIVVNDVLYSFFLVKGLCGIVMVRDGLFVPGSSGFVRNGMEGY